MGRHSQGPLAHHITRRTLVCSCALLASHYVSLETKSGSSLRGIGDASSSWVPGVACVCVCVYSGASLATAWGCIQNKTVYWQVWYTAWCRILYISWKIKVFLTIKNFSNCCLKSTGIMFPRPVLFPFLTILNWHIPVFYLLGNDKVQPKLLILWSIGI